MARIRVNEPEAPQPKGAERTRGTPPKPVKKKPLATNKMAMTSMDRLLEESARGKFTLRTKRETPRRDRTGYVQKNRQKKVGVQVFLEPDVHAQFKQIAETVGVPVNKLMHHLIETTITHGANPAVRAAIKAERARAERAHSDVLAAITPGKFGPT